MTHLETMHPPHSRFVSDSFIEFLTRSQAISNIGAFLFAREISNTFFLQTVELLLAGRDGQLLNSDVTQQRVEDVLATFHFRFCLIGRD